MKRFLFLSLFLLTILSGSILAQVTVTNNNDSGAGSLRDAISQSNASTNGLRITINPGIGTISLLTALPDITKSCTIIGASTVNALAETGGSVIECNNGVSTPFRLLNALTGTTFYLQDLILQRGGGGVSIDRGAGLEMLRCVARNNTLPTSSTDSGGGVQAIETPTRLTNCLFRNNSAVGTGGGSGGGVASRSLVPATANRAGSLTVVNSAFVSNTAVGGGGLYSNCITELINCSFFNNQRTTGNGGAIRNFASRVTLTNTILWDNNSAQAISTTSGGNTIARYCLIESGATAYQSSPTNLTITSSPFTGTSVSIGLSSPAVDAGDNTTYTASGGPVTDLTGNCRFFNGRIDMGAVEFLGEGLPVSFMVLSSATTTCAVSPTITLSGSETGVSYQLLRDGLNGGTVVAGTGAAISFGPQSLTGTYTIQATRSGSCTVEMIGSVIVATPASVSITPTSGTLSCTNQAVSLSAIGSGTVVWSTGASTSVISATVAGTFSVTLTNSAGCQAISTAVISGTVLRTPTVTTDGPVGCGRSSAQITIQAVGANSFTLLGPGGFSAVNGSGVFSVTAGGSYTGLASQSGDCTQSGTVVVSSGGIPSSASDFRPSGSLGQGSCTVRLVGTGTGNSFVMTGPDGYVFSNVYQTAGTYSVEGLNVRLPGTYMLTVYRGICSATYTTVVSGTACSSGQ